MSFTPENSAIKTDAALEEAISKATSQSEVLEIMRKAALEQNLVQRDWDPNILVPVEQPATPLPQKFAKSIRVNGQTHVLEAGSELELAQAEISFFRELISPNPETKTVDAARNDKGQFVSAGDAAARAELELRFKRGDIDAATYLAESGAIDSYLASRGVSLPELQQVAQQNYASEWKSATDQFLARHPDWEGGDANLQEVGRTLERLNLLGAPTVESLEAAYQDMRQRNAIAKNPELEKQRELHSRFVNATSFSEIQETAASSLFGRR